MRIVFHIGAGKTGTSSIQQTLQNSQNTLRNNGFDYWGLMLEYAPVKLYDWQMASATKEFLSLDQDEGRAQVGHVLRESIKIAEANNHHTIIWSNEWFFGRHQVVLPSLKLLQSEGINVDIIAYVRRHDAWARSAYTQWGIKHKTYTGPIIPFSEYIKKRPVKFAPSLEPWVKNFPENFILHNFDAVKDVAKDFLITIGISQDIEVMRANDSPGPEELLLRALYNNSIHEEALPVDFDRLFRAGSIDFNELSLTWFNSLLPGDADLKRVLELSSDDIERVNKLLSISKQALINRDAPQYRSMEFDSGKMLSILFKIITQQALVIKNIQHQLKLINKDAESDIQT